jgi:hypothetical protein
MKTFLKPLAVAATLIATLAPAKAGDNSCLGKIVVEGSQAKIVVEPIKAGSEQPARVCGTFAVASSVGQRILKICPNGSECFVNQPLPRGGVEKKTSLEIKKPFAIERMPEDR